MGIMNDFCIDMMERLASEAKQDLLLSGSTQKTLREWHFNTATKLVLPGELKKHGVSEGTKAVRNYETNKTKVATGKKTSPK
jgi:histone H2B